MRRSIATVSPGGTLRRKLEALRVARDGYRGSSAPILLAAQARLSRQPAVPRR